VKLAKLKTVQMIRVPGNMGIDGNEVPEQLAKQGSLFPLTGLGLVLGKPTKVAWEVIKGWTTENTMGIGCLSVDKDKLKELYIFVTVHRNRFLFKDQLDAPIIQIYFVIISYMFRGTSLPPSSGVFYCTIATGKFHAGFLMTASKQSQDGNAVPS
jgi:hypothetical protein